MEEFVFFVVLGLGPGPRVYEARALLQSSMQALEVYGGGYAGGKISLFCY